MIRAARSIPSCRFFLELWLVAVVSIVMSLAQAPERSGPSQESGLQRLLEVEVSRFPATVGLYIKHLPTGEEAGIRDSEPVSSMSIIKIPIMMKAYQMADRGMLDLDQRVVLTRADIRSGSGILKFHAPGTTLTVRDLITYMIIVSDNSAAEMMIDRVGGRAALNDWLMNSDYTHTRIASTSPFRAAFERAVPEWKNLTTEEIMGLQLAGWNDPLFELYRPLFSGERQQLIAQAREPRVLAKIAEEWKRDPEKDGSTSPREAGRMLEAIEQGTAASRRSSAEMKVVLRRQILSAGISRFVNIRVGHKTGADAGVQHDVGLLYAKSGTIVFAFFSVDIKEPSGEFEDRIARLAKVVVDYFDGAN